jgi:hypothetical protein
MSLMLRNFEYLAGGNAGGEYIGANLSSRLSNPIYLRDVLGIESYANNSDALTGGLSVGDLYYNTTSTSYVIVQAP